MPSAATCLRCHHFGSFSLLGSSMYGCNVQRLTWACFWHAASPTYIGKLLEPAACKIAASDPLPGTFIVLTDVMFDAAWGLKRSVMCYVLITGLVKSVDVLCSSAQDSTLSVRVSAVSALANLADAWQQQQHQQLNAQLLPSLTKMAAGMPPISTYWNCVDCQESSWLPISQLISLPTAHQCLMTICLRQLVSFLQCTCRL